MKILTKEEEAEHYSATLTGGITMGIVGLGLGTAGVMGASRRYHFIKNLTLPLKAFLITSSGTFAGIIGADHASRSYEMSRNPIDMEYRAREESRAEASRAGKTFTQRAMDFGKQERYKIVGASWIASMAAAFALVNRNKYLTGPQKLVQARVYAQFLTLGVLVASAAFEISDSKNQEGHWETVKYVDPNDPEHKRMLEKKEFREGDSSEKQSGGASDDMWKDMVAAEEERLKERDREEARLRKKAEKKQKKDNNGGGDSKSGNNTSSSNSDKSDKSNGAKEQEQQPEKKEKETGKEEDKEKEKEKDKQKDKKKEEDSKPAGNDSTADSKKSKK